MKDSHYNANPILVSTAWIPRIFISITDSVTTSQGALIIGGYHDGSNVATVACYSNAGWSRLDDLQSTRYYPRAIINGDKVYK